MISISSQPSSKTRRVRVSIVGSMKSCAEGDDALATGGETISKDVSSQTDPVLLQAP